VVRAFANYTSDILVLIDEGNASAASKMRFRGDQRKELFGVAPNGRHVWWIGMPTFTFDGPKVCDLSVLGGIYGLIQRLKG
jgi:predicted ester cyclase